MGFFSDLSERHEALKKRIHAFRIPLSPRNRRIMEVVYFSIPLIAGYFIMQVRCFLGDSITRCTVNPVNIMLLFRRP